MRAGWKPEDRINAQHMYEEALSLDPQFAQARARLAILLGDPEEAKQALKLDPELPEGHLAMAISYFRYYEFESARHEFGLAEKGLPESGEIAFWRAIIADSLADWDARLRHYEEAVRREPRNPEYLYRVGKSLRRFNRYREAIVYYDRALALAPDFEEAKYHRAAIHLTGFGDPQPLRKYLSELPEHETRAGGLPPNEILYNKWSVEYYSGDYSAALAALAETDEETFNHSRYTYNRWHLEGLALYRMGRIDSARTALETARFEYEERLKKRPNDITDKLMLGIVVAALGEKDRAIEISNRVLELCRSRGEREKNWMLHSLSYLAIIFTLIGEYDQAIDYLDHFFSLGLYTLCAFFAVTLTMRSSFASRDGTNLKRNMLSKRRLNDRERKC